MKADWPSAAALILFMEGFVFLLSPDYSNMGFYASFAIDKMTTRKSVLSWTAILDWDMSSQRS